MADFYSPFRLPERPKTEHGRKLADVYTMTIDDNGHKELKKTGRTNLYAKIQAAAAECEIENILAKFDAGQIDIINQTNGTWGVNAMHMPKTYAEMQNMIIQAKQEFEALPAKVRAAFDNSAEVYISQLGTEKFMNTIKPFITDSNQKGNSSGSIENAAAQQPAKNDNKEA